MGALGGLYRPTPRGTMVIWPGVGPGCQCLWSPASPPAAGARRLVGPAGCLVLGRQAAPAACGSCRQLNTMAMPLMMCALSGKAWLQCRRLVGVHCSHSPSLLVNDAQTLRRVLDLYCSSSGQQVSTTKSNFFHPKYPCSCQRKNLYGT